MLPRHFERKQVLIKWGKIRISSMEMVFMQHMMVFGKIDLTWNTLENSPFW